VVVERFVSSSEPAMIGNVSERPPEEEAVGTLGLILAGEKPSETRSKGGEE
jgi:hypothetical protein